jgi:ABC-type Mn2+/Zn2+ transport system ATPase subunit
VNHYWKWFDQPTLITLKTVQKQHQQLFYDNGGVIPTAVALAGPNGNQKTTLLECL